MSIGVYKKIVQLEIEILHQGNEINSKKARKFYDRLISYHEDYMKTQREYWSAFSNDRNFSDYDSAVSQKWFQEAECTMRKINWLQEFLKKFIEPVDQPANTAYLNSLIRKQTFYINMIESITPRNELSLEEAKLYYEHVSQYYEKFISNQSEIMTVVEEASFQDQVTVAKDTQLRVISVQKMLKDIFSPSKMNDDLSRMRRSAFEDDFVESPYQIQESLIQQIELIEFESNNNPELDAKEAEVLLDHLSEVHESFVKNQAIIESDVTGSSLEKELEISRKICLKVMFLKTKLRQKFAAPVVPLASNSNELKQADQTEQLKVSEEAADLNSLLEAQKSLVEEIDSIYGLKDVLNLYRSSNPPLMEAEDKLQVESALKRLPVVAYSFFSNHLDIGKLINESDSDVLQQKEILNRTRAKLAEIGKQFEFYVEQL